MPTTHCFIWYRTVIRSVSKRQAALPVPLKCQGVVINNYVGCDLLLDGGAAGLNILGKGYSNGIYLYTTGHSVDLILKGKINIVADNKYGVSIGNSASLSAAKDAKITASGGLKAILDNNVHSPFLEWRFEASLGSGKTLEIKRCQRRLA